MKSLLWITIPAGLLLAGLGFAMLRSSPPEVTSPDSWADLSRPRHPVTQQMRRDTLAMGGRVAYDFELPGTDGRSRKSSAVRNGKPAVVVMTKDGCPCSIESQPFFNELARLYGERVQFVAVMDAKPDGVAKYQSDFKVPYPMFSEMGWRTYKEYRAPRSVYVTLVRADGTVAKMWPGYSKSMLLELSQGLAQLGETDARPFDASMAPETMTSGCAFHRTDGS